MHVHRGTFRNEVLKVPQYSAIVESYSHFLALVQISMALLDSAITEGDCVFRLPGSLSAFSEEYEMPPRKRARLSDWLSLSNDGEALLEWPQPGASHQDNHDIALGEGADLQHFDSLCELDFCAASVTPRRPRAMAIAKNDFCAVKTNDPPFSSVDAANSNELHLRFVHMAQRHNLTALAPCGAESFPSRQHLLSILNSFTQRQES